MLPPVNGMESGPDALEPIAVVGFSLKFPQDADSPASFWKLLAEKRCAMTEWPEDRIHLDGYFTRHGEGSSKTFVPGAHFVKEDLGMFDASFFGISATEATAIDPQHRILLETAYRALENAGIPMERSYGTKTGVYSGSMADDYKHIVTQDAGNMPKYVATGVSMNMVANRLSWFFNFTGPSVNLDSACSSSLMALDMACQGLRNRDSDMALVAGSSMILAVEGVLSLLNMSLLSPLGRCFTFDDRASGYSRGEGFSVLVVKRLHDAISDGNVIRAVIRSTGSNQDGYTPGLTQPSRDMQARLIAETYKKANLDYSSTRYFEAHGTGTRIGDPIEADAIGSIFRTVRSADDPLYLGAVKSNIGHLEGGSGLAGVIKAIMVLEKGIIPPNANFERLNPEIDAEFLNIKIPTEATHWPTKGLRRASVASFGFGGSNAHAILDDAYHYLKSRNYVASHCSVGDPTPNSEFNGHATTAQNDTMHLPDVAVEEQKNTTTKGTHNGVNGKSCTNGINTSELVQRHTHPRLLVWSAADEKGISRLADVYQKYFSKISPKMLTYEDTYLEQLANILAFRRSRLSWRAFAIADSVTMLKNLEKIVSNPMQPSKGHGLGYIFTGQGAQYYRMGIDLVEYDVFRRTLSLCDQALQSFGCQWSIVECLKDTGTFDIQDPEYAQPLTTALQICLVELLSSFGLSPSTVVGHSSGEIAAAYAYGALSLQSACKVSYFRGIFASLLKKISYPGAMLAVDLSESDFETYLQRVRSHFEARGNINIACFNSPSNLTISGNQEMIDYLKELLDADNIVSHLLRTGVAYHSPQMAEVATLYRESMQELSMAEKSSKKMTMISSVTGLEIADPSVLRSADYWVNNMVNPVKFSQALTEIISRNNAPSKNRKLGSTVKYAIYDLVEIGPHSALQRPVRQILNANSSAQSKIRYSTTLDRRSQPWQTFLSMLGNLHAFGYSVDLDKVNRNQGEGSLKAANLLVDLPEYPFNHSRRYWFETNTSKNVRLPPQKKLELLGTPAPESTPLEAKWRKFFDVSETPWVEHHQVNGKIIYPATGMAIMAVEGARQLAANKRAITGFLLKDATFTHPISISTVNKTEVHLCMRPLRNALEKDMPSYEFRIYIGTGDQQQENCRGTVSIQYENSYPNWSAAEKLSLEDKNNYQSRWAEAVKACSKPVPADKMYQAFEDNGLNYGPSFQLLDNLAWDGEGGAIGDIKVFQWTPEQSQNSLQHHIVHPATLDVAGQLAWVALTKGAREVVVNGAAITRVQSAWISSSGLAFPETKTLKAYAQTRLKGLRGTETSLFALDEMGQVRLWINKLETTSVSGNKPSLSPQTMQRRSLCYLMDWKPDLRFFSKEQLLSYCRPEEISAEEPVAFHRDLEILLLYYVRTCLAGIKLSKPRYLPPHLQKYVAWLEWQLERHDSKKVSAHSHDLLNQSKDHEYAEAIAERICHQSIEGKLFVAVGKQIQDIINGSVDPLETIFQDGLVDSHYRIVCDTIPCCKYLKKYLGALAHKNPSMKILEVGAGTGSLTGHIIDAIAKDSYPKAARFLQYDYTDISEAFFENARERFSSYGSKVQFKILNIEINPEAQGYELGSYDIVVAAWVLHATRDLNTTVKNVKKLLKPGGKLVLLEITKPDILRNGFIFGTLPGWWIGTEDCRKWSACISEEQWSQVLSSNGFNDFDMVLPDYETESCREHSLMISTAVEINSQSLPPPSTRRPLFFIVDNKSQIQTGLVDLICEHVKSTQHQHSCKTLPIDSLGTIDFSEDPIIVFLPEVERPLLIDMDESEFVTLQTFLCKARTILWIAAAERASPLYPQVHLVRGLARVLCTENNKLSFVTASLEDHSADPRLWAKNINDIISVIQMVPGKVSELEYQEENGVLHINRVDEANSLNTSVFDKSVATPKMRPFQSDVPLTMIVSNPGFLDSALFVEDEKQRSELGPNEVEIRVQAVGINFRDLLIMVGKYGDGDTLGLECAGTVTRVGSNCSNILPGDRVGALIIGCLQTFARCDCRQAVKIPDNISFSTAAAILVPGFTAYHSLVQIAHLKPNESILIHSGAGGTGQMAIQIAQTIGAEIFVTVGSDEKKELLKRLYNIPDDHILYSRDLSFARDIKRLTTNKGVDVVLNSLSADGLVASWECIAPFGRFVELGKIDVESNSKLPMIHFAKNVSFSVVAVDLMCSHNPALIQPPLEVVVSMVGAGTLAPASPLQEFPVSKIEDALRLMQGGKHTGKLVINLNTTDPVPTQLRHISSYSLPSDATYLIAGGLGGLGRSAARWMASMGAKNLILLSRSGPKSDSAQELIQYLTEKGIKVKAPKCDVTSATSLSAALEECSEFPPIRGCLQGTMVLQDSIFENMTFSQWQTTIHSKVQSTHNLHALLPDNMDFFIMLSSLSGIAGSISQSNYAAGNTFQDAFAHYRKSIGLRAVAFDLGWMGDIGIIAENEHYARGKEVAADMAQIMEKEFHALLEHYCNPVFYDQEDGLQDRRLAQAHQVLIGLVTPAQFYELGLEPPEWLTERGLFRTLPQQASDSAVAAASDDLHGNPNDLTAAFGRAGSAVDACAVVVAGLTQKLARALGIPADEVDLQRPLASLGVDSLLAIELRNWFSRSFKADTAVFDITGAQNIEDLAALVVERSEMRKTH